MNEVIQLVNTVGFPIAGCIALCYYIKYLTDQHTKEIDSLRKVIDDNTKIVTKLYEIINNKE